MKLQLPWASREEEEDGVPLLTHPAHAGSQGKLPKVKNLNLSALWKATVEFLAHPFNVAVTVWTLLTVPACIVLGLDWAGLWDKIMTDEREAEKWVEISTQVANALSALMCLICMPLLIRQTILLIRWTPTDKIELRQFYCKNGTRKPHDRTHISIVVFFAHLACLATFAFTAIYWVYAEGQRPAWLINTTFSLSLAAPIISAFYLLVSPLSKNYDIVKDSDAQQLKMYERSTAFFVENKPIGFGRAKWSGGVFPGCCVDRQVACCVTLLPLCMFGHNLERLGLGHRAVHASAFFIVLVGPLLVFAPSAAALRHMGTTAILLVIFGVLVGLLGLSYGGLWRTKVRQRFGLPGSMWEDLCIWMWCSLCALCQEIRTADQYDVGEASSWTMPPGALAAGAIHVPMEDDDFPHDYDEPRRPMFSFSRSHRSGRPSVQHMQRSEDDDYF